MTERPRVYHCRGVVLRRRNLGEADSIFTIYADPLGKFDAVARGVRKVRSKMRGHLEPLTLVDLLVARGRNLDVITQASTIEPYLPIRDSLERSAASLYCAELVDRLVAEHAHQDGLLELITATLDAMAGDGSPFLVRWFELQVLGASGYELQLDACGGCGGRLPEEETFFGAATGGLVCRQCRPSAGAGRLLSVRAVKLLRFARATGPQQMAALRYVPELDQELAFVLNLMVRQVLDREPKSASFMDDVRALDERDARALRPEGVG